MKVANDISVIVVPELEEFKYDAFNGEVIHIHATLGEPKLKEHNAKYVAPYWLDVDRVERIYEIIEMHLTGDSYQIYLGNSYVLKETWDEIKQRRKFEYHSLESFGFKEVINGFLVPMK
jgi:hypothetical protein